MNNHHALSFMRLNSNEQIPYELLLLADPSKKFVDEYLPSSYVFIAKDNHEIVGVVVVLPLREDLMEIKNIAIKPELQGRGIGSYILHNIVNIAAELGYQNICIGTANSSIGQLYLYQKHGFEIADIKRNFFTDNYAEPIYENGIQAKHLLMLTRQLSDDQASQNGF